MGKRWKFLSMLHLKQISLVPFCAGASAAVMIIKHLLTCKNFDSPAQLFYVFGKRILHPGLLYLLLTVRLHHVRHVGHRSLDVENLDHLLVNCPHQRQVSLQQGADGAHGDGPVEESAAHEYAAPGERLLLMEVHLDEAFVLVGLVEISLRELLDLSVDPQDLADGLETLHPWWRENRECNM